MPETLANIAHAVSVLRAAQRAEPSPLRPLVIRAARELLYDACNQPLGPSATARSLWLLFGLWTMHN